MLNASMLRGKIAESGLSQRELAAQIGINTATFYRKMKRGVFDSDEIYQIIKVLGIENPIDIFFADVGT